MVFIVGFDSFRKRRYPLGWPCRVGLRCGAIHWYWKNLQLLIDNGSNLVLLFPQRFGNRLLTPSLDSGYFAKSAQDCQMQKSFANTVIV